MNKKQAYRTWKTGNPCPICVEKGKTKVFTSYSSFRSHMIDAHGSKAEQKRKHFRYMHFKKKEIEKKRSIVYKGRRYTRADPLKNKFVAEDGKYILLCPHFDCTYILEGRNDTEEEDRLMKLHYGKTHPGKIMFDEFEQDEEENEEDEREKKKTEDVPIDRVPEDYRIFWHCVEKYIPHIEEITEKMNGRIVKQERYGSKETKADISKYILKRAMEDYAEKTELSLNRTSLSIARQELIKILFRRFKNKYAHETIYKKMVAVVVNRRDRIGIPIITETRIKKVRTEKEGYFITKVRCPYCYHHAHFNSRKKKYICNMHDTPVESRILEEQIEFTIEIDPVTEQAYLPFNMNDYHLSPEELDKKFEQRYHISSPEAEQRKKQKATVQEGDTFGRANLSFSTSKKKQTEKREGRIKLTRISKQKKQKYMNEMSHYFIRDMITDMGVHKKIYSPSFTCVEFSNLMIKKFAKRNIVAKKVILENTQKKGAIAHAMVIVVANDGAFYIEPQTGRMYSENQMNKAIKKQRPLDPQHGGSYTTRRILW